MPEKALLGQVGVYFMACELSRQGYIALVTTKNTKSYEELKYKDPKGVNEFQWNMLSKCWRHNLDYWTP